MIINSAMINSKDVLEMKLNNAIVYSATPAASFNYTFLYNNTDIPTWINQYPLFNTLTSGRHFQADSLAYGKGWFTNMTTTTVPGQVIGYLLIDLTNCTTALKIDVYSYYKVSVTGHGAVGNIATFRNSSATSVGTLTNGKTVAAYADANNYTYNTATTTITLDDIAACKYYAIRFYVSSGATSGSAPELHVGNVTFTQV
jgi:hypothetical protein